ncbi:hypothetical protein BH10CHL1_BH10CHL1_15640 [soil metagenome]
MGTLIEVIALIVAGVGLVYTWKLHQELNTASRRLDRYNRALFDANDEIRHLREEMATTTAQLRVELKQVSGDLSFQPEMTVREVQMLHPQAQQILAGFHLGGCSSCAIEPDDTLAKICAENELDLNALIGNLNLLVAGSNGRQQHAAKSPTNAPEFVKIPNVELSI